MSFLLFESFFVYFLLEESKLAGLLADVGEDAAVNVEDQAVDKVGCLGSEEHGGAAQILGLTPTLGRGLGNDELVKRMTGAIGLDLAQRSGLRGGDVAGSDAVALDVVLAVLGGNVLGQHLQTALGSGVGGDSLAAQFAHHGADVDDLAAALLDHIGNDSLGNDEGSVQVNVDDLTELGSGHLDHRDALDDTGVVDQHIDVADLGGDLLDHLIDGVLVGDVADIAVGFDAGFLVGGQALVDQLLLDVVKDDLGAAIGHSGGNGKADAVGSAGDEGDLTGQVEGFRGANRHDAKPPKFVTVIYSGAHHWGARIKVNSCAYLAQAGAKYVRFLRSAQISCGDIIHIIELHVLAAHGPDKGVIRCTYAAVDAPGRADDRVIVVHDNMAGLGGLTAHVENDLALGDLKVGVDLHAALVGVAGHGVPVAAGLQSGHTHGQLAGLEHAGMDELVDRALVAGLDAAQRALGGLLNGDELVLIAAMGRGRDHVELGRMLRVVALEGDLLVALGQVQAVLVVQVILLAIRRDRAGTVTDVEDADLAALQEVVGAEVGPYINALVDGDLLVHRHAAQRDHAIHVAVDSDHLICLVQAGDEHFVAGLLGGVALEITLVAGITNIHTGNCLLIKVIVKKQTYFAVVTSIIQHSASTT